MPFIGPASKSIIQGERIKPRHGVISSLAAPRGAVAGDMTIVIVAILAVIAIAVLALVILRMRKK
jgi:hypothetical protein